MENIYNIKFEDLSNYNFTQSSLLLFDNYEYFIDVDISKYYEGENIIVLIFGSS